MPGPVQLDELRESNKETEGQAILTRLRPQSFIIALDERGQDLTSLELAQTLKTANDQAKLPTFIIGGADGLVQIVLDRADLSLRFGRVVWPHQLIRGMLAEQMYRAQTIQTRHPYHRM